jgi:hypothetical protein
MTIAPSAATLGPCFPCKDRFAEHRERAPRQRAPAPIVACFTVATRSIGLPRLQRRVQTKCVDQRTCIVWKVCLQSLTISYGNSLRCRICCMQCTPRRATGVASRREWAPRASMGIKYSSGGKGRRDCDLGSVSDGHLPSAVVSSRRPDRLRRDGLGRAAVDGSP